MYDVILIDLDNTILDFDLAEKNSLKNLLETMGLVYSDNLLETYRKTNSTLWQRLEQGTLTKEELLRIRFRDFFKTIGIIYDGEHAESIFRMHLDQSDELLPNAHATLKRLKQMNKRVYSASNGMYATQMSRLKKAGLLDLFAGHFISEKVQFEKPSRHFFNYCFEHIDSVSKSGFLMVGDSLTSDIQGAVNAGIDSCLIQRGEDFSSDFATYVITDLYELVEIV